MTIFRLYTWGWGVHGQLGHNSVEDCHYPQLVGSLSSEVCDNCCYHKCLLHINIQTMYTYHTFNDDDDDELNNKIVNLFQNATTLCTFFLLIFHVSKTHLNCLVQCLL